MVTLAIDKANELAFDVAAGFFDDRQLCVRYSLSPAQLKEVQESEQFLVMCDEHKRMLDDGGSDIRVYAREQSRLVVDTLVSMLVNDSTFAMARIKAAQMLLDVAGVKMQKPGDTGGGIQLVINTNLALGAQPGNVYTLEAKSA